MIVVTVKKYEIAPTARDRVEYDVFIEDNSGRKQTIRVGCSNTLKAVWDIENNDELFHKLYPLIRETIIIAFKENIAQNINGLLPMEFSTYNSPDKPPQETYDLPNEVEIEGISNELGAYAVFISNVEEDKNIGNAIKGLLEDFDIKSFVAHDDIELGEVWEPKITKTIENTALIIVVASKKVELSAWVNFEVGLAYSKMFPFLLEALSDKVSYIKNKQGIILNCADIDKSILRLIRAVLSKLGLSTKKADEEIISLPSFIELKALLQKDYCNQVKQPLKEGGMIGEIRKNKNVKLSYENGLEISIGYSESRLKEIRSSTDKTKYFIMTATPIPLKEEILDTEEEKIKNLMLHPSYNRGAGWNMDFTSSTNNLIPTFDGIKKDSGTWSLRLFRNAHLEFHAEVDYYFSWNQPEEEFKKSPRFNPYAITEFPVSFIRFLKELVRLKGLTHSYRIVMAFLNCGQYKLRPYSPRNIWHSVGQDNIAELKDWTYKREFKQLNLENDEEAFIFIERLYNTFNLARDKIPFFNETKIFEIKEK